MASDWKLISCGEEHEMVYMLGKCGKELSNSNIKSLLRYVHNLKMILGMILIIELTSINI